MIKEKKKSIFEYVTFSAVTPGICRGFKWQ